jgi:hypothetical protein
VSKSKEYEWRQSGIDACSHAFPAAGEYIAQTSLISVVPLSNDDEAVEEFFGPYDAYIAICGHKVPVAMLMPQPSGVPCTACQVITGAMTAIRPYQGAATDVPPHGATLVSGHRSAI